jgi:hypothetical protein
MPRSARRSSARASIEVNSTARLSSANVRDTRGNRLRVFRSSSAIDCRRSGFKKTNTENGTLVSVTHEAMRSSGGKNPRRGVVQARTSRDKSPLQHTACSKKGVLCISSTGNSVGHNDQPLPVCDMHNAFLVMLRGTESKDRASWRKAPHFAVFVYKEPTNVAGRAIRQHMPLYRCKEEAGKTIIPIFGNPLIDRPVCPMQEVPRRVLIGPHMHDVAKIARGALGLCIATTNIHHHNVRAITRARKHIGKAAVTGSTGRIPIANIGL